MDGQQAGLFSDPGLQRPKDRSPGAAHSQETVPADCEPRDASGRHR